MSTEPIEVRQCPKCQQPAVLLVMDWKQTLNGFDINQSTKEYRCQSCGVWFVRRPRSHVIALWILGVMFLPACLMGLPYLYFAQRQRTFDRRIPVVTGVPVPRLRFRGGPPKRTCRKCEGVASAVNITRNTSNGVPTGTDYEYQCTNCCQTFMTENTLGSFVSVFFGSLILGAGAAFYIAADHPGWRWGGSLAGLVLGLLVFGQVASRVSNRFLNKPMVEHVL